MLRFGTLMCSFTQFMTCLLVNFWVTFTSTCSPGSFRTSGFISSLGHQLFSLFFGCIYKLEPDKLHVLSSSREGKYGHTCVVALQNGSFVNGARKVIVTYNYLLY